MSRPARKALPTIPRRPGNVSGNPWLISDRGASGRLSNLDDTRMAVRKRAGPVDGTIHDPGHSSATHTCR